jgi:hypothetical protein
MAQSQNTLDSRDAGGNNSNGKDMTSTLLRGQVLDDLAQHLYDFLPGQPHPYADASISFSGVARDLGLGSAWQGGSKRPALRKMLEFVIDRNGNQFTRLLVMIVERSMTYRRSKIPLCREEIEELNSLVTRLGFKAPELHDPAFLDRLPRKHPVKTGQQEGATTISDEALTALREKLTALNGMAPQKRGYAFESFLNELFDLFSLAPRGSFRLVGEQIDGSFQLGQDVYLVEAKWQNEKTGQADLLSFSGKVEGKAHWSRGMFVSYTGFSEDGLEAFARGKATRIICMEGLDLYYVLQGKLDLREVIDRKMRRAGETNRAFVSMRDLFPSMTF